MINISFKSNHRPKKSYNYQGSTHRSVEVGARFFIYNGPGAVQTQDS